MNGLSITLVFGSYGGFHLLWQHSAFRICLGWVAFTIYGYDLENKVAKMLNKINQNRRTEGD